jgi:hypothetical protein
VVEHDAEQRERLALILQRLRVPVLDRVGVEREVGRPFGDVGTVVAVLQGRLAPRPSGDRMTHLGHLGATVVDIELAGDDVADALEEPGQRVAEDGAARVTGVQRPRRIRGDELHHRPPATADLEPGEALLAVVDHPTGDLVQPRGRKMKVHETRAGDLDTFDVRDRRGVEPLGQLRRELPWRPRRRLCARKRNVGRPVAVLTPGGLLQVHLGRRVDAERRQFIAQCRSELLTDHGVRLPGRGSPHRIEGRVNRPSRFPARTAPGRLGQRHP